MFRLLPALNFIMIFLSMSCQNNSAQGNKPLCDALYAYENCALKDPIFGEQKLTHAEEDYQKCENFIAQYCATQNEKDLFLKYMQCETEICLNGGSDQYVANCKAVYYEFSQTACGQARPPASSNSSGVEGEFFSVCGRSLSSFLPAFSLAAGDECLAATVQCQDTKELFCDVPVKRSPGLSSCAPTDMSYCGVNSCAQKALRKSANVLEWKAICSARDFSDLVYEQPEIDKAVQEGATSGEIASGAVPYVYRVSSFGVQEISFRGTKSACNAISDLDGAWVVSTGLGGQIDGQSQTMRMHRGFFLPAQDFIQNDLPNLKIDTTKPVSITGHSLGGAIANIVALLMLEQGYIIDKVITFGAPMVTDAAGVKIFDNIYKAKIGYFLLVMNGYDIVPYSLNVLSSEPQHFGQVLKVGMIVENGSSEFGYATHAIGYRMPPGWFDFSWITDHLLTSSYHSSLEFACGANVLQ